ncbi:hypothetical protein HK101_005135, partial [Irineochytrium annulatum]
ALVANAKGDLSKQAVQDWPVPTIGDNEVLVRVEAAGREFLSFYYILPDHSRQLPVNPVDFKIVKYGVIVESYPTILGSDAAGRVVSVGSKVTMTKVGARVFFQAKIGDVRTSSFQQYAAIHEDFVREIADSVSFDVAATLAVAVSTTAVGLGLAGVPLDGKGVAGKHILLFRPLQSSASASHKHHDEVKSIGASHMIDFRASDATAQIRAITGDDLTLAFDTVGAESSISCIEALSFTKPANIAVINAQPEELADALKAHPYKSVSVHMVVGNVHVNPGLCYRFLDLFAVWLNGGDFKPQKVRLLGRLDAVKGGQDAQIAGTVSGEKLVVHP